MMILTRFILWVEGIRESWDSRKTETYVGREHPSKVFSSGDMGLRLWFTLPYPHGNEYEFELLKYSKLNNESRFENRFFELSDVYNMLDVIRQAVEYLHEEGEIHDCKSNEMICCCVKHIELLKCLDKNFCERSSDRGFLNHY